MQPSISNFNLTHSPCVEVSNWSYYCFHSLFVPLTRTCPAEHLHGLLGQCAACACGVPAMLLQTQFLCCYFVAWCWYSDSDVLSGRYEESNAFWSGIPITEMRAYSTQHFYLCFDSVDCGPPVPSWNGTLENYTVTQQRVQLCSMAVTSVWF